MASISMCIACWGYTFEVMEWTDTSQEEGMRTWQEVAASHCHRSAGRQKRRTTAGSQAPGKHRVSTSGGTLLWDNRRLIGRSLIVLARKVQNNRD